MNNMTTSQRLRQAIAALNLQQHPFYQDWMAGKLTLAQLQNYAVQYNPHVKAFPRFVSAVHSQCESTEGRKLLLENLMEEEGVGYASDHPQLWADFAAGLGVREMSAPVQPKAEALVDCFHGLCRTSYAKGLAALFAYEYQVPEIAKLKIEGLKQNYNIDDAATLSFFSVHEKADVAHTQACSQLLDALSGQEANDAVEAGVQAAQALWDFLTEAHEGAHAQKPPAA